MAMRLNLAIPSVAVARPPGAPLEEEEAQICGRDIAITFLLPSGSSETITFKLGQNVEWMKAQLAKKLDIEYQSVSLFLGDNKMPDPLSLNDFPAIVSGEITNIRVELAQ
eukprot:GILI01004682.1.p1 GENE.GILI01004682.1~~GILI01004682.1.p1  ORF type:complete len:110 (+),score=39.24 GILI01004682.1:49-378(+)